LFIHQVIKKQLIQQIVLEIQAQRITKTTTNKKGRITPAFFIRDNIAKITV